MNTKNIAIAVVLVAGLGVWWYMPLERESINTNTTQDDRRVATPTEVQTPQGKIKADVFSGKLEEVNEGCYVDGECYVVVGGKHVTVVMGWSQEIVGGLLGVESFGDLNNHIGKEVEVYAQEKADGTYTLYGSSGFYVKLK